MKNRFDLEQEMLDCWRVTSDIHDVYDHVMNQQPDTDTVANMLLGIHALYELKFNKLWDTFEQCIVTKDI